MLNYRLFYVIFILIIYYITTFIISFSFITKSIVNEDPALLKKYIYQETLENNFYNEIYDFNTSYIKKDNEKIIIKGVEGQFSGELINDILNLVISKISKVIAADLSNPSNILYFYKKTSELNNYFIKVYKNLGNYSFEEYLQENDSNNNKNFKNKEKTNNNKKDNTGKSSQENTKVSFIDKINKIIKRYKSTDYFFLINPIYFKIEVAHKEIPFSIFLRFNGYKWKVEKINMSLQKFIDQRKIRMINYIKKD